MNIKNFLQQILQQFLYYFSHFTHRIIQERSNKLKTVEVEVLELQIIMAKFLLFPLLKIEIHANFLLKSASAYRIP